MKRLTLPLIALLITACAQEDAPPTVTALEDDDARASYAIGYRSGEQLGAQASDLDTEALIAGLRHGMTGEEELLMDEDAMDEAIMAYQQRQTQRHDEESAAAGDANREAGENYRAENAERDEVTVLDSGLQYEVLESGDDDAASPGPNDIVVAHYHGTLVDGTVFDSSVERGEPASFPLNQVIEGWQQALVEMRVGDKWRIVIPPELGYGDRGAGQHIGPGATLIFEVELLDIEQSED